MWGELSTAYMERTSCLVLAGHLCHEIPPACKVVGCFPRPGTSPAAADPCHPLTWGPVDPSTSQTTLRNPTSPCKTRLVPRVQPLPSSRVDLCGAARLGRACLGSQGTSLGTNTQGGVARDQLLQHPNPHRPRGRLRTRPLRLRARRAGTGGCPVLGVEAGGTACSLVRQRAATLVVAAQTLVAQL